MLIPLPAAPVNCAGDSEAAVPISIEVLTFDPVAIAEPELDDMLVTLLLVTLLAAGTGMNEEADGKTAVEPAAVEVAGL